MAVSRALSRLLRLLELEEEQAQGALELALTELRNLEAARRGVAERERAGRRLVAASARSGETMDRLAGLEEARLARRLAEVVKAAIAAAEKEVLARREAFLARRVARRQAETLIDAAEARAGAEAARRGQQTLDEWFLERRRRSKPDAEPAAAEGAARRVAEKS